MRVLNNTSHPLALLVNPPSIKYPEGPTLVPEQFIQHCRDRGRGPDDVHLFDAKLLAYQRLLPPLMTISSRTTGTGDFSLSAIFAD